MTRERAGSRTPSRAIARPRTRRAQGWFKDEILPVSIPQKKGDPIVVDRDESIREDTTAEALARLKPAFKKDGTVTAGNAPGVNDGAAALVVMARRRRRAAATSTPLARIVGQATAGLEPKLVLMTPVEAVRKLLKKTGWKLDDVDLVRAERGVRGAGRRGDARARPRPGAVNVHGGAVALGHPIGASGARVLTTLLYALKRHGKKRGIATLCLGGGNGVALAIERSVEIA